MGLEVMVTTAQSALVKGYASTVVDVIRARNVEGVKYASTVVYAVSARNAKGVKNEASGTEAEKHAVALPSFPTDNSILARLWSSSSNDELLPGVMELRIRVG